MDIWRIFRLHRISYTYRIDESTNTMLQFWHWSHIVCFVYTRTAFANRFIVAFHICISCLLNACHVDHPFTVRICEMPRKMICLPRAFRFTLLCDCLCYIYSNFMHFVWLVTAMIHAMRISSNQNIQYNIALTSKDDIKFDYNGNLFTCAHKNSKHFNESNLIRQRFTVFATLIGYKVHFMILYIHYIESQ